MVGQLWHKLILPIVIPALTWKKCASWDETADSTIVDLRLLPTSSNKLLFMEIQGLRTLIYSTNNLEESKTWWSSFLGKQPYFDQPFYVGFDVGGYELGLTPTESQTLGQVTYFGVDDIEMAVS